MGRRVHQAGSTPTAFASFASFAVPFLKVREPWIKPAPRQFPLFLRGPSPYHPPAMTRAKIEFAIKIFLVLLILAFSGAVFRVLSALGVF